MNLDLRDLRQKTLANDGENFPSAIYRGLVLEPAYDEAKTNLLAYMHQANRAHLAALFHCGIISGGDASTIKSALDALPLVQFANSSYSGEFEDLFFAVEDWLIGYAGDAAGNLHIARSRNDMGVALYRLALRNLLLQLISSAVSLENALAAFASEHTQTAMIAHTHTQQAQPTTLGHYVAGVVFMLDRDIKRLQAAYAQVNRSPLGAAAITTSGFPLDRELIRSYLGFESLIENSYDAIGGGDYIGETAACAKLACNNLGRFINDLLLWSTQEFGYMLLAAPYIQISSIMPQKRNPVSIEHMRSLLSSASGDCSSALLMLHNTPYGDIVDTEDDAQPYLWRALKKLDGIYNLLEAVIATAHVDAEKMEARAGDSFAVVTELADTLVREAGIPFRMAHSVAQKLVNKCLDENLKLSDINYALISDEYKNVVGTDLNVAPEIITKSLKYKNFIEIRSMKGGPEVKELTRCISIDLVEKIMQNTAWLEKKRLCIDDAIAILDEAYGSIP